MTRRLIIPAVVLLLTAGIETGIGGLRPVDPGSVTRLATFVLAGAFLLAWRFRRGRLAVAAVLGLALAELLAGTTAGLDSAGRLAVLQIATLFVALDLAILAVVAEWRVASTGGGLRLLGLALQGGAAWLVAARPGSWGEEVLSRLRADFFAVPADPPVLLPHATLTAFLLAAVLLGARLWRRQSAFDAALLGSTAAFAVAAGKIEAGLEPNVGAGLFLLAGGVVLVLGLLEGAYSLAFEDGLTGLPARRSLEESLHQLGGQYAVAMVDIDHFKRLNDRHGHEVGDQVLRMVAAMLGKVDGGGKAFRYGGEEFTLLFPGRGAAEAEPFAEALRRAIAERRFTVRSPERPKRKPKSGKASKSRRGSQEKQLRVTVSVGLAERSDRHPGPAEVMKAADRALYRAKRAGRNRLVRG